MLTILFVPSGTVCLECIIGGALATEASFQIENNQVASSEGTVVNGTLVVFDSETTFSEENTIVRCMSGSTSHQAFIEHGSKSNFTNIGYTVCKGFRPPVISGVTTVNEGDTLNLNCDSSNSRPLPPVKWLSPDEESVSNIVQLRIAYITRTLAGNYTCIATHIISGATMSSSAYITILCECTEADV